MRHSPDPTLFVKRVIDKHGGRKATLDALNLLFAERDARWEQDIDAIGRILRSHLFVEHYLQTYIVARNPNLRSVADARLSFTQTLALAKLDESVLVAELRPGIKRLNIVRNRLAHNLRAEITEDDAQSFLSAKMFVAMRNARAAPAEPCSEPLTVLEEFARYCGIVLDCTADNPFEGCFDQDTTATDS